MTPKAAVMTDRQKQIETAIIAAGRDGIQSKELAVLFGVSIETMKNHLERVQKFDTVVRVGWTKNARYVSVEHESELADSIREMQKERLRVKWQNYNARRHERKVEASKVGEPDPILTVRQSSALPSAPLPFAVTAPRWVFDLGAAA